MSKKSLATSPDAVLFTTASTTISAVDSATYMIGSAGAVTLTVPAPVIDGVVITFVSTTAQAHVVASTGSVMQNGVTANRAQATLDSVAGAGLSIISFRTSWYVISEVASPTYA